MTISHLHLSRTGRFRAAKPLTFMALLLLGACSNHTLASCQGPVFPLNAGRWQPSGNDLTTNAGTGR
jgi:type IV secretion system protein VirB7